MTTSKLFDPTAGQGPPGDAVELYVEAPLSLGILYSAAVETHNPDLAESVWQASYRGVEAGLRFLQEKGGYVKAGRHRGHRADGSTVGHYAPAPLSVTVIHHRFADDHTDVARIHSHIYLGTTAVPDGPWNCMWGAPGTEWPVDMDGVKAALTFLMIGVEQTIESLTTPLGALWGAVPGYRRQIVAPALAGLIETYPRRVCASPWPGAVSRWWVNKLVEPPSPAW